jgi:hypothetical protein
MLDTGYLRFKNNIRFLDVSNRTQNIVKIEKKIEKENNGFKLIQIDGMNEKDIEKWCKENNLPEFECINEINEIKEENKNDCTFNKTKVAGIPINIKLTNIDDIIKNFNNVKLSVNNISFFYSKIKNDIPDKFKENNLKTKRMVNKFDKKYEILNIQEHINKQQPKKPDANCKELNDYNLIIITKDIEEFKCVKGDCFIIYYENNYETLDKSIGSNNPMYNKEEIFTTNNDIIKYSVLKNEYLENLIPDKYYWKTPDGWLYLHDKDKTEMCTLKIKMDKTDII